MTNRKQATRTFTSYIEGELLAVDGRSMWLVSDGQTRAEVRPASGDLLRFSRFPQGLPEGYGR